MSDFDVADQVPEQAPMADDTESALPKFQEEVASQLNTTKPDNNVDEATENDFGAMLKQAAKELTASGILGALEIIQNEEADSESSDTGADGSSKLPKIGGTEEAGPESIGKSPQIEGKLPPEQKFKTDDLKAKVNPDKMDELETRSETGTNSTWDRNGTKFEERANLEEVEKSDAVENMSEILSDGEITPEEATSLQNSFAQGLKDGKSANDLKKTVNDKLEQMDSKFRLDLSGTGLDYGNGKHDMTNQQSKRQVNCWR